MRIYFLIFVAAVASMAWPALAQHDPVGVTNPNNAASVVQILLQQGITGAIAVVCLVGLVFKDRQITKERDAWSEKLLALSMSHAAETARTTALMERITQLMDRVVRHFEKGGHS